MRKVLRLLVVAVALVACANSPHAQSARATIAELWQEPTDLQRRDLYYGPGGFDLAPPQTGGTFAFVAHKTSGTNPGYDVRDSSGRLWSVKLGIEAQPEVTVSRILWAMGYHQPPVFFVHDFTLTGTDAGVKQTARFRTEPESFRDTQEWSWYDNPFVNTTEFRGLVVAQLILNQWDMKTPNNHVYESSDPSADPRRWFVVRDVGAALGHSKQFPVFALLGTRGMQGSKNNLEDFEAQGFITGVDGDEVAFDYRGINQPLVDRVTRADVVWACERLDRLTDAQWQAAFRAGAFPRDRADRYISKIRDKIAQGLALREAPTR